MSYRDGNVGESVWVFDKTTGKYLRNNWVIHKTNIKNEHGYPVNLAVKNTETRKLIVTAPGFGLYIFPPASEIPGKAKAFAKKHNLLVIRNPYRGEHSYQFVCPKCEQIVHAQIHEDSSANFEIYGSGRKFVFREGKAELNDGGTCLGCGCEGVSIDEPEDVERYY